MEDTIYKNVLKHWEEVTSLPPQRLGIFTPIYKEITKHLKVMPWLPLLALSIVVVVALYFLFGSAITFLVSILQRGF